MTKNKDLSFLIVIGLVLIFFGLAEQTTKFFFPNFGSEIYKTINFYNYTIQMGLSLTAIVYIYTKRAVPNFPWYVAIAKFIPSFIFFHYFISFMLGAALNNLPSPALSSMITQGLIALQENTFGLVLLPYIVYEYIPQGSTFNFFGVNLPDFKKILSFVPTTVFMTGLHFGAYSQQVATINDLYTALVINFILFMALRWMLEVLGFGVSEGAHMGWNTALIRWHGSVY